MQQRRDGNRASGLAVDQATDRAAANQALRRALIFLCSHRRDTFGALAALIAVTGANLLAPQLIRLAVDLGLVQRQPAVLAAAAGGLVAVAAVRGLFSFLQSYLAERASQGVAYDLRDALFVQIERLSFSFYDRAQTGQLLTRLTSDVEQIRTFVGGGVVQLVSAGVMLAGSVVLLLALNWRLA